MSNNDSRIYLSLFDVPGIIDRARVFIGMNDTVAMVDNIVVY